MTTRTVLSTLIVAFVIAMVANVPTWADPDHSDRHMADGHAKPSLYKRLGGYDAIVAVTADFIDRLAKDPVESRFFVGLNDEHKARVAQLVVEFLVVNTGGPGSYVGRPMKEAHKGLGITENDWSISVKHLTATLDKFNVPEREKNEVLNAISGLKNDIVEKP